MMAEPSDEDDDVLAASSQEDLVVSTATAEDDTMSESGGDLPETTTVTENGEGPQQQQQQPPEEDDDDEATASEDEDPDDSSPPKSNGISIHISKKPPPPTKPRPTLKLTLNSKKLSTTTPKSMRIKLKLPTQANTTTTGPSTKVFPPKTASTIVSKQATGMGSRRRPVVPSKQVRLPPIASPGLVVVGGGGGKPKAASVFDTTMAHAGYTEQQRSTQPHRGSSVRRTVGDLFDTDTRLALHRIELVPAEILEGTKEVNDGEKKLLANVLQERLAGRKRPRVTTLREMAPVSLTLPYPDTYRQDYLQYLRKVDEREQTIVEWQEAAEMIEELDSDDKNPVIVPPIPPPPEPPKLSELQGLNTDLSDQRHPLYLPTSKDGSISARVSHLDPDCFHITQGRYFGLTSNRINDPQVCGPNAPGCSGSGGLATATTSTTTSTSGLSGGGMTLILSAGFHCAAAVPIKEPPPSKPVLSSTPSTSKLLSPSAVASTATALPELPTPTTTENANALRMVMMDNEWAEQFRVTIWKAAVYACRTQQYDTPFTGPNGHVYPDLGRAFSGYALVKPCLRCKNNKQGVYHCRVRRKHREADFDGGNSVESLTQYRDTPLELLLETPLLEAPAVVVAATPAAPSAT